MKEVSYKAYRLLFLGFPIPYVLLLRIYSGVQPVDHFISKFFVFNRRLPEVKTFLSLHIKGASGSNFDSFNSMLNKFVFFLQFLRRISEFFDFYIERYMLFFFPLFVAILPFFKQFLSQPLGVVHTLFQT